MSGYRGLHMMGKVMLVALTCYVGAMAVTVHGNPARKPEQIHLALGETLNQMTVMWSTWLPTKESIVEYGTAMEGMISNSSGSWQTLSNRLSLQYIHSVKLNDLSPGTKYFYRCGDGKTWSTVYSFNTPRNDSEWKPKFIIYGDLGYKDSVSVKELIKEATEGSVDVILHNGDLAYDLHTDHGRVGDNFMNLIEPIAARVPYMVSVGNHEAYNWNYTNYKTRFRMPGTPDNLWYSFKVGPIHFVILSTEVYFFLLYGGMEAVHSHYTWLEDTLKEANKPENRKQWPWVITLGHRPMYCSNTALRYCRLETNPVRIGFLRNYAMEDLLYKYGVDMAFWGHNHCYERLWPTVYGEVYNGSFEEPYRNPRGPVHITSGVADGEVIDKVWIIKEKHGSYFKLFPADKKKIKSRGRSKFMRLLEPLKFLRQGRSERRSYWKLFSK